MMKIMCSNSIDIYVSKSMDRSASSVEYIYIYMQNRGFGLVDPSATRRSARPQFMLARAVCDTH